MDTPFPDLWLHNPDVIGLGEALSGEHRVLWMESDKTRPHGVVTPKQWIPADYNSLINKSNEIACHYMESYCRLLESALCVRVPLATNRPHVWLADRERHWLNQVAEAFDYKGEFWLLNAGHKSDITAKFWGTDSFQKVVDSLRGKIVFVQVGSKSDRHPRLRNVYNLVGKTDLRQLVRLCWHASGALTGVSFLHHLAAAMERPCVTIMGGREPVAWNQYPKCQLLHTVGALPCCQSGGCWRAHVTKVEGREGSVCDLPQPGGVGKCMTMVRAEDVAERVMLSHA